MCVCVCVCVTVFFVYLCLVDVFPSMDQRAYVFLYMHVRLFPDMPVCVFVCVLFYAYSK